MPERRRADVAGPRDRWRLLTAATVYVLAWVLGLLVAPSAPDAFAPDTEIHAYFVQHGGAALGQALLVHGVAGLALAAFVLALARRPAARRADPLWRAFVAAGLGAAVVSLAQLGAEIALKLHVGAGGDASTTATLFHAVNIADTIKLILLAAAVATATRLAADTVFPRWLRGLGFVAPVLLVAGGMAFVIDSAALDAVLALSLVVLLVWVAAVAIVCARPAAGAGSGRVPFSAHRRRDSASGASPPAEPTSHSPTG